MRIFLSKMLTKILRFCSLILLLLLLLLLFKVYKVNCKLNLIVFLNALRFVVISLFLHPYEKNDMQGKSQAFL